MKKGFLLIDEKKNTFFFDCPDDKDDLKKLMDFINISQNMNRIKEHRTLGDLDLYVHDYIKKRGEFDDRTWGINSYRKILVDTVDYEHMTTKEIFELGRALGTIDQIIMQQTKEILLKAGDNNEWWQHKIIKGSKAILWSEVIRCYVFFLKRN